MTFYVLRKYDDGSVSTMPDLGDNDDENMEFCFDTRSEAQEVAEDIATRYPGTDFEIVETVAIVRSEPGPVSVIEASAAPKPN